ncbi:homeobox protein goosecoid-like [Dendronephthya gigantea]|uniref:homeobox protein goosecoid-like n=1 Tax=Dendronephthya gigantea TaxID=151771 RepID=UPI0010695BC8|nr:homeobox protein goosecoid-like [Dendronephthya gigantea]
MTTLKQCGCSADHLLLPNTALRQTQENHIGKKAFERLKDHLKRKSVMALSFSIDSILAKPTYRPIKPMSSVHVQPYPALIITPMTQYRANGETSLPPFPLATRKRRKRYRTIFNEKQIELLEELYRTTPYPDLYQRENVALHAGLQEERVEVWFKNRRARTRKLKRAANKESLKDKEDDENVDKQKNGKTDEDDS